MPSRSQKSQIDSVVKVVKDFICSDYPHDYFSRIDTNAKLEEAMRAEMKDRNIVCRQLECTLHVALAIVELSYTECTFEEKKNQALYTWYVIYLDDMCANDAAPFIAFQQRFLHGLPQLDPVLDAFASLLQLMRDQYDDMAANVFLSNSFDFVNATLMEAAIERYSARPCSPRFAGFLRERSALGVSYAIMVYPKSRSVDFLTFYQALPDMDFWIAAVNDLLSFYKEELAGETATYVCSRASAESKDSLQVLSIIRDEVREASENIARTLSKTPAALAAWRDFQYGYIAFHVLNDRYKLKNLSL